VPKALPAQVYPLVPPHVASGLTLPVPAVHVPNADWQPAPQYALVEPHHPADEQHCGALVKVGR
jgi:hypothetical protein